MQNIQSISNDIKISYHLELILIRLNTERAQSEPVKTRMFLKIFGKYAQDTSWEKTFASPIWSISLGSRRLLRAISETSVFRTCTHHKNLLWRPRYQTKINENWGLCDHLEQLKCPTFRFSSVLPGWQKIFEQSCTWKFMSAVSKAKPDDSREQQ